MALAKGPVRLLAGLNGGNLAELGLGFLGPLGLLTGGGELSASRRILIKIPFQDRHLDAILGLNFFDY